MTACRRLLFIASVSPVALLVLSVAISQLFLGTANADPANQMMGGRMRNGQGMQGMTHRRMRDNVPPGVKPQDLPEPDSKGARLTVRYCMQCHNLASPSMHTAKEWKVVADRMFRRMSSASTMGIMRMSVNVPSSDQQKEILEYLEAHALKPVSPRTLSSPKSPGAVAFRSSCSERHALPGPELHKAADWPAVVREMQSYAKQMNKEEITNQQAKEIEHYLASQARAAEESK